MGPRDKTLDIAKGLLIIMLVLHHITDVSTRMLHIDNLLLNMNATLQPYFILSYFMPCFFLITGYCSNFNCNSKEFILKQFLTILLPAITFTIINSIIQLSSPMQIFYDFAGLFYTGGAYWFLISLFEAKLIYFYIRKVVHKNRVTILILLLLMIVGVLSNEYLSAYANLFCHRHSFDLLFFLAIGNIYKDKLRGSHVVLISAFVYICACVFIIVSDINLPYVTLKFATDLDGIALHIILSLTGSVILIALATRIHKLAFTGVKYITKTISYIGMKTLVIYLTQANILLFTIPFLKNTLSNAGVLFTCFIVVLLLIGTIGIGLAIDYFLMLTKLRIILGKVKL